MRKIWRTFNLIVYLLTAFFFAGIRPLEAAKVDNRNMAFEIGYKKVDRVAVLEKFFDKYKSPLKDHADTFVKVADKYGIDYALLPSISCQESTCAKFLIENSHNPFGWGIYGNQYIAFESYDQAIEKVGEGLYKGYFSRGLDTLYEIAPVYTPPSNGSWYRGVTYFSNQIGDIALAL
jgi:hypothetical protein